MHTVLHIKSSGYSEYTFYGNRSFLRRTVDWAQIVWA